MIKLNTPTCNYSAGEFSTSLLTNVTLDNSNNLGLLKEWILKTSMSVTRAGGIGFSIGTNGYICGGHNGSYLNTVESYDTLTGTWSNKTNMNIARRSGAGFNLNDKGYVCGGEISGGETSGVRTATVEMYDPVLNTWTNKTSMSYAKSYMAHFSINNKGYVCGGEPATDTVEMYDPVLNTWTNKTSQPTTLILQTGFSIGINGYVCGGRINSVTRVDYVYSYNSLTNTWSSKSKLLQPLEYATGFNLLNFGYVVGGYNGTSNLNTLYQYNPTLDSWTSKVSALTAKREQGNFVAGNKAYVCGGYNGTSYFNTVESIEVVLSDIYYTTDGTDPVTIVESPVYSETLGATAIKYTEPFDLPLPAVLKARAYPTN